MSLFYGEWSRLQDLIMATTILFAAGVLVSAVTAYVRAHHGPGGHPA